MKHTLLYLKIIVFVALALIMVTGFIVGGGLAIIGIFSALSNMDATSLILVPMGLFCGLLGFAALDTIEYLDGKWSWKV